MRYLTHSEADMQVFSLIQLLKALVLHSTQASPKDAEDGVFSIFRINVQFLWDASWQPWKLLL